MLVLYHLYSEKMRSFSTCCFSGLPLSADRLEEALFVALVFPCQQVIVKQRKRPLLLRFLGYPHPLNVNLGVEKANFGG